jgi:D-methionine transport system ATP-binding protein
LQGKISYTQTGSYGTLFVHLDGDLREVEKVIAYIHEQQVEVEVMTNA